LNSPKHYAVILLLGNLGYFLALIEELIIVIPMAELYDVALCLYMPGYIFQSSVTCRAEKYILAGICKLPVGSRMVLFLFNVERR